MTPHCMTSCVPAITNLCYSYLVLVSFLAQELYCLKGLYIVVCETFQPTERIKVGVPGAKCAPVIMDKFLIKHNKVNKCLRP